MQRITNIFGEDLPFRNEDKSLELGEALRIFLPKPVMRGKTVDVVIYYETNENQTAISWVSKEQTLGKHFPYMYSYCETINCRSISPM